MNKSRDGVIYIVTTQKGYLYLESAIRSAKTLRRKSKKIGVHVFTDVGGIEYLRKNKLEEVFTSSDVVVNPHYRSKVDYISKTPYERTLYLDSDTEIVADISEMFSILDRFDLAAAHAHKRKQQELNVKGTSPKWKEDIPPSFPQYNGGVILFKKNPLVMRFLDNWRDSFHEAGFKKDQITFRELLWLSDLRLATLPPEYNIRYEKYLKVWSREEVEPKILHMAKFHRKDKSKLSKLVKFYRKTIGKKHAG